MGKSLILSNGQLLVGMDQYGQVNEFQYPRIGQENHLSKAVNKLGVFVDNSFSWLDDGSWEIAINTGAETMSGVITAHNALLNISLEFNDVVYNEKTIYIRRVHVTNTASKKRDIKIFFNQQFRIYEAERGDTAFYDPYHNIVIHYKSKRVLLVNASYQERGLSDHSIGLLGIEGKEGTYKDAEDGDLAENHIEHGLVDSVVSLNIDVGPQQTETCYYWVAAARTFDEAHELNQYVLRKSPDYLIDSTEDYWRTWMNKHPFSFHGLPEKVVTQFKKSLWITRACINDNGSVIASPDSDLLKGGRDSYGYHWHRDAALVALALDKAGYSNVTRRIFEFSNSNLTKDGYFMHKYLANGSLGASWHPWIRDGKPILPIQEDETALVIFALWEHYNQTKDLEFLEKVYNSLVVKSVDFLLKHMDYDLYLPLPSYDLWEQTYAVSCFTASSVYGALEAAARFADILGKKEKSVEYREVSHRIRRAVLEHFFDDNAGYFYKNVEIHRGEIVSQNKQVDISSVYGIMLTKLLDPSDPRLQRAIDLTVDRLTVQSPIGGLTRFENDTYAQQGAHQDLVGNPWIITTLWIAQFNIAKARTKADLKPALETLEWAASHATSAGLLPEQLDPYTGIAWSVTPLTWSHAEYIRTVIDYLDKLEKLGIAPKFRAFG